MTYCEREVCGVMLELSIIIERINLILHIPADMIGVEIN